MAGNVDVQKLEIILEAQTKGFERAMDRYGNRAEAAARKAERAFERQSRNIRRSSHQMSRDLRNAVAGVAIGLAGREVIQYADAWTEAGNKIAAAGTPLEQQAQRLGELADLAIETRSSFDATASLFARLGIATENLTGKQYDLLKVTELINKATVAGGASEAERRSTILQLSQALASGQLMGEELRSLRENAPILLRAVAKEFEVPIGALKELGAEGELTSTRILDAIISAEEEIADRFGKTDTTIGDSLTNLKTRLTQYIGTADDGVSASEQLANAINFVATNVDAFVEGLVITGAALVGAFGAQAVASALVGLASITAGAGAASRALVVLRASALTALGPLGLAVGAATAALAYFVIQGSKAKTQAEMLDRELSQIDRNLQDIATRAGVPWPDIEQGAQDAAGPVSELARKYDELIAKMRETGALARQNAINSTTEQLMRAQQARADALAEIDRIENKRELRRAGNRQQRERLMQDAEQALTDAESAVAQATELRSRLFNDTTNEDFRPAEGTASGSVRSGGADSTSEDAIRALEQLREAYNQTFSTERELVEQAYQERVAAIRAAGKAGEDAAELERQAAAVRKADLKDIADQEAQEAADRESRAQQQVERERELVSQILDERDYLLNRTASILEREYELKRAQIDREIQDEQRKNEAIAAMEEERRLREMELADQLTESGIYSRDPVAQLEAEQELELEALQDALNNKLITWGEYYAQLEQMTLDHTATRAELEARSQQQVLGATQGFFATMNSLAEQRFGEGSALAKGFFLAEKAIAAAQVIVDMEVAKVKALAQLGPIAGPPAVAAIQSAGMLSLATIAAQTVMGFERGGYTGGGGRKDVAGVVHGQEFVAHANATAKNMNVLQAMNRGADIEGMLARLASSRSSAISMSIHNNAPGVVVRREGSGVNQRFIIEQAIAGSVAAIQDDIASGGGPVSGMIEGQYGLNRASGSR